MKKFIIPLSIIAAGIAGFFIGKAVAKKDEEQRIQEAVNNYKESYQKRRKEIADYIAKANEEGKTVTVVAEGDLEFNKDKEEDDPEDSDEDHRREVKIISENEYLKGEMLKEFKEKKARAERKENKYRRKHIDYDPKDEYYEDELDEDGNPPGPSEGDSDPYEITYEEYVSENVHFDKKAIIYYEENDVLVYDETDECIVEDTMLFGDNWREMLENDNGTCYIRNEKLSTDFELILKEGAYVE